MTPLTTRSGLVLGAIVPVSPSAVGYPIVMLAALLYMFSIVDLPVPNTIVISPPVDAASVLFCIVPAARVPAVIDVSPPPVFINDPNCAAPAISSFVSPPVILMSPLDMAFAVILRLLAAAIAPLTVNLSALSTRKEPLAVMLPKLMFIGLPVAVSSIPIPTPKPLLMFSAPPTVMSEFD